MHYSSHRVDLANCNQFYFIEKRTFDKKSTKSLPSDLVKSRTESFPGTANVIWEKSLSDVIFRKFTGMVV